MRLRLTFSVCSVVAGLLFAGSAAVAPVAAQAPAQDTAKGAALMAEARKALGGEDKLAAIKRLEVKGESRRAQGNQSVEGDLEILLELPDKYLRKEELMIGGNAGLVIERIEVLNGTEAWEKTEGGNFPGGRGGFGGDRGGGGGRGGRGGGLGALLGGAAGDPAQGQPGIDPERLREAQRRARLADVSRLMLGMLLATNGSVAWIGTAQSPDGTADVLEITIPDVSATRLLLDTVTHMPLMMTWQGAAPRGGGAGGFGGGGRRGGGAGRGGDGAGRGGDATAGGPPAAPAGVPVTPQIQAEPGQGRRGGGQGAAQATLEMHLTEYKVVNGIKLPHVITRGSGGQTTEEFEIKSYKINPSFKANTFIQDK